MITQSLLDNKEKVQHRESTLEDKEDKAKVSEEILSEKCIKTKQKASNEKETNKITIRYLKFTVVVSLVAVVAVLITNTELVKDNIEYIKLAITDKDDCLSHPCYSGGECVDKVAGFECLCKQWYTGKRCETGLPCVNHQCKNGATCITQSDGSYSCICPYKVEGRFCEIIHRD